jgi:hypothetical protein
VIEKKVERLLADYRPEHSEFQIENFIIGAQGNEWARYRQALRELASRHDGFIESGKRIAELGEQIERERRRWFGRGKAKQLERERGGLKKQRKSKAREYCSFYRIARDLKRRLGEISAERRRELEAEMWIDKARRMAAIDLLSIGGLQRSTVEFITSFPRELRRQIFLDLRPENRQKLLSILD